MTLPHFPNVYVICPDCDQEALISWACSAHFAYCTKCKAANYYVEGPFTAHEDWAKWFNLIPMQDGNRIRYEPPNKQNHSIG